MSYDDRNALIPPGVDPDDGPRHVMSIQADWLQFVVGACEHLRNPNIWHGTEEERATIQSQVDTLLWLLSEGVTVGNVGDVGISFASDLPAGRLWCDGTQYNRVDYPELYAALDAAFIVDADRFVVPDLRERVPVGAGGMYVLGSVGGAESVRLDADQLPEHTHHRNPDNLGEFYILEGGPFQSVTGGGGLWVGPHTRGGPNRTGPPDPVPTMPPYVVCRYWIQAV